jgi:aminoglycoside phosphotransferase family enzyme/predicted kinase
MDGSPIDEIAQALSKSSAWPTATTAIESIQTHISHVFLVGDRVFKLRKAVRLPFLDFSTRALRNADCLREVTLNRRLAPTVYLGVAPVIDLKGRVRVGPIEESPKDPNMEYVVVMRRLPAGRDALSMLENQHLEARHLEAVAARLETFHASHGLGCPAPWTTEEWFERIEEPVLACVTAIAESNLIATDRVDALKSRTSARLTSLRSRFEARRLAGRAVDGHGDLHLDHIWFEEGEEAPLVIDCVEFNDDLRRIDPASEVAFLAMDLRYRKRADLAEFFLHAYARRADDYGLFGVVDFFSAYRALVRAKVAALAALQPSIAASQRAMARVSVENHLTLAESLLEGPASGALILLCGTVGSGKSTIARQLALSGCGIPIASDRVRKALAGLPETARTAAGPDQGIYRPDQTERVYIGLLERATAIIEGGRTAILDASFSKRAQRDAARAWADGRGIPIRLIEVRCDPDIAGSRLRERERIGTDPSDAGPDFLPTSRARFEAPDEWPASDRQVIWSSRSTPPTEPNASGESGESA